MILDEILAHKREEVQRSRARTPEMELERMASAQTPPRSLLAALRAAPVAVIAEVKRRSPSRADIYPLLDPPAVARSYAEAGAAAISVLTDERFFGGSLADLRAVRQAVDLPLLRKDFTVNAYQVLEGRAYGADAVLLIAGVLDTAELRALREYASSLGMDALVEVHTEEQLESAVASGAEIIGINNRDLRTFATTLEPTLRLAPLVPADRMIVGESGIGSRADVERLAMAGVGAVLVGESLLRSPDPAAKLRELRGE